MQKLYNLSNLWCKDKFTEKIKWNVRFAPQGWDKTGFRGNLRISTPAVLLLYDIILIVLLIGSY